jgi:imidazolonepropionase-like amidohydrolase
MDTCTVLAGHLLDVESGTSLADQAVRIAHGRVESVVPIGTDDPSAPGVIDLRHLTVLPGLIDCHTHLVGVEEQGQGYSFLVERSGAQEALAGVRNARVTLLAGFTSVRDVGTFRAFVDVALRDAIAAGDVVGPRMRCAGAYITCSGGGGDVTGLAVDVDETVPRELRFGVADSVDDVRRAARRILRGGADFVKVIGTGAVLTAGTNPGAPEMTEDQLRAAVEEAASRGTYVAVHAHGTEGIKRAIRAGARSIEHGSLLDDECIEMMLEHRTYLVADIYDGDWIAEFGRAHGWSCEVLEKSEMTTDAQRKGFRRCVEAGVPIAFGTDAGVYPHGGNARQLAYHVRFGQSALEAIRSATVVAAELLDRPDVGRLAPGCHADLIAVAGDPLVDVSVLEDVRFVMQGGRVVKDAGVTLA